MQTRTNLRQLLSTSTSRNGENADNCTPFMTTRYRGLRPTAPPLVIADHSLQRANNSPRANNVPGAMYKQREGRKTLPVPAIRGFEILQGKGATCPRIFSRN